MDAVKSVAAVNLENIDFANQMMSMQQNAITPFGLVSIPHNTYRIFSGSQNIFLYGHFIGSAHITKYIFNHGFRNVNNEWLGIFDTVTVFSHRPAGDWRVRVMTGRIHSHVAGSTYLQSADLNSNHSGTMTVSLSASGPGLQYAWNPHNAIISRRHPYWAPIAVTDWEFNLHTSPFGATRDLVPALRIGTANGAWSRGIFSSIRIPIMWFCGVRWTYIYSHSAQFEAGQWF